jgi:hypothetical protein
VTRGLRNLRRARKMSEVAASVGVPSLSPR